MEQLFEAIRFENQKRLIWDYKRVMDDLCKTDYHWHQCCEVLFVHEGKGNIVINQQMYNIRKGMLFFFQPYQMHHIYTEISPEHPFIRTNFYIEPYIAEKLLHAFINRKALFTALWQGLDTSGVYDLSSSIEVVEWVLASYERSRAGTNEENSEDIILLLLQLMNCLDTGNSDLCQSLKPESLRYSEQIMSWIEKHYHEEVNLDQLAEEVHLSKSYVSRIFHQETGGRLVDYLTARRIHQACRMLGTTTLSVEQIGNSVGFPNPSYFNQLFKRVLGITPLKYRKSHYRT